MSGNRENKLNEPLVTYVTDFQDVASQMVLLFGGLATLRLKSNIVSDFDLLELTRRGIPKKAMLAFLKKVSLTIQELAAIMHINERTFQRFDEDTLVKTEYTEKAIELAKLYTRGEEVFGSLEKFKTWMKTPSHVFKDNTPLSLLDSSIGFGLVFTELGRIQHGIFS